MIGDGEIKPDGRSCDGLLAMRMNW